MSPKAKERIGITGVLVCIVLVLVWCFCFVAFNLPQLASTYWIIGLLSTIVMGALSFWLMSKQPKEPRKLSGSHFDTAKNKPRYPPPPIPPEQALNRDRARARMNQPHDN